MEGITMSFIINCGSFSDRVGRKTEYPISNTEYPTDEGKKRQIHSIVGEN
jgi:hypothetical protein